MNIDQTSCSGTSHFSSSMFLWVSLIQSFQPGTWFLHSMDEVDNYSLFDSVSSVKRSCLELPPTQPLQPRSLAWILQQRDSVKKSPSIAITFKSRFLFVIQLVNFFVTHYSSRTVTQSLPALVSGKTLYSIDSLIVGSNKSKPSVQCPEVRRGLLLSS